MKTKIIGAVVVASSLAVSSAAFAGETISVVGSSSVSPLMEVLGETYAKSNDVTVEVQGPGSSAGIRVAHDGSADLGMSSRALKTSEESPQIKEIVVARDGIAVVVNNSNPVTDLTKEQITEIYKGNVTNWNQVGGEDKPIVVATRDTASGTRGAFEDIMSLKKKINNIEVSAISQKAQVASGNGQLKTTVANNPFAIGYISLGSVDNTVKPLTIDGHKPSVEAIKAGDYSVQRPFIVVYKEGHPSAEALEFLTWVQSPTAQKIVADKGFISVN
ncbi:phosphate ABC transporter substrate-binding protein [Photobacterium kishitanii]|uniref:Phosphate-binding protein n=1 Tax=Photobacterium kishitanii TaxID=318456 RepID=A0A0B7JBW1_9GAMM|nr:phosphate ABC transporter substrate-binding protein [Photobacterium kishitanii]OBU27579.1 phosphate ABC transporter substrate-binding protein [Photobacterium kishitanii]PSU88536.1 phosphate ABC transporter substrate-binding protein [Photobacterium kishitanii]PSU91250.1 phosphate ABC transporter substrate-binding protein [Photobacterium kishitanii]PSV16367.1 phosphate ABC transporter substrate-binding protein [Photobacterium kishitanii]PSW68494.1 phosphate ABC transporter substrate-binding p